jgi:ABC-type cobalt transport system substrate-binding protein
MGWIMKINLVFSTVIMILLIAIINYCIGASNQKTNPDKHFTSSDTLPTKDVNELNKKFRPIAGEIIDPETGKEMSDDEYQAKIMAESQTESSQTSVIEPPVKIDYPQTPDGIFAAKYENMKARAYVNYQLRMRSAGAIFDKESGSFDTSRADSISVQCANACFQNDTANIENWHRLVSNKFSLINREEGFTPAEKNLIRNKVLAKTEDPIYLKGFELENFQDTLVKQQEDLAQRQQMQQEDSAQQEEDLAQQQQRQRQEIKNRLNDIKWQQQRNDMKRDNWQLKYNPFDNKYQYASPDSQLKYNPFDNKYQYASPDSQLKYNSFDNKYRYASPDSQLKYNSFDNKYQYASPDSQLKYNSFDNKYQYASPDSQLKYNPFDNKYQYVPSP